MAYPDNENNNENNKDSAMLDTDIVIAPPLSLPRHGPTTQRGDCTRCGELQDAILELHSTVGERDSLLKVREARIAQLITTAPPLGQQGGEEARTARLGAHRLCVTIRDLEYDLDLCLVQKETAISEKETAISNTEEVARFLTIEKDRVVSLSREIKALEVQMKEQEAAGKASLTGLQEAFFAEREASRELRELRITPIPTGCIHVRGGGVGAPGPN